MSSLQYIHYVLFFSWERNSLFSNRRISLKSSRIFFFGAFPSFYNHSKLSELVYFYFLQHRERRRTKVHLNATNLSGANPDPFFKLSKCKKIYDSFEITVSFDATGRRVFFRHFCLTSHSTVRDETQRNAGPLFNPSGRRAFSRAQENWATSEGKSSTQTSREITSVPTTREMTKETSSLIAVSLSSRLPIKIEYRFLRDAQARLITITRVSNVPPILIKPTGEKCYPLDVVIR